MIRYIVHAYYQNQLPTLPGALLQNSPTRLPVDVHPTTDIVPKEAFLCNLWKVANNGGFVGLFQTYHVIGPAYWKHWQAYRKVKLWGLLDFVLTYRASAANLLTRGCNEFHKPCRMSIKCDLFDTSHASHSHALQWPALPNRVSTAPDPRRPLQPSRSVKSRNWDSK